ncbi:hypothetical protein HYT25_01410 [Candidatus Pacearchaeota archaeon]|nr:hypothetical protein [Candidatus Pacearchaeota archaeon]
MAENTTIVTLIIGFLGIILGTFLSPYLNHRLNAKYERREIFFKKKLEYFEEIAKNLEENIKIYKNIMGGTTEIKNKKEFVKILNELKKRRRKFRIMASPLYFNTNLLAEKVLRFINLEKRIFTGLKKMIESGIADEKITSDLKAVLDELKKTGSEVINEMKKELHVKS